MEQVPYLIGEIVSIEPPFATMKDSWGKLMEIRIDIRRGGGRQPRVGETWLVDRTLGEWTFAAIYSPTNDDDIADALNKAREEALVFDFLLMGG